MNTMTIKDYQAVIAFDPDIQIGTLPTWWSGLPPLTTPTTASVPIRRMCMRVSVSVTMRWCV